MGQLSLLVGRVYHPRTDHHAVTPSSERRHDGSLKALAKRRDGQDG